MPQLENGYLKIANELFDALIRHRIPGEQRQCFDFIIRKTYGFNKKEDHISNSQFVEATKLNKSAVSRAIKKLIAKNMVLRIEGNRIPLYRINKRYETWILPDKKMTTKKGGSKLLKGRINLIDIKDLVRDRDENKCQVCQFNGMLAKEKLDVHHIDFNQINNPFTNLITLCKSCHAKSHNHWEKEKLEKIMLSKKITNIQLENQLSKMITNISKSCQENTVIKKDNVGDLSVGNNSTYQGNNSNETHQESDNSLLSKKMDTKDSNNVTKDRDTAEGGQAKTNSKNISAKLKTLSAIAAGNFDQILVGDYAFIGETFPDMQIRAKRELEELKRDMK